MSRTIRDPRSRQRIIDSACHTIAERGLRGATMRVIAADAGVTTGFVTHYFDDKAALTHEVLAATNLRAGARALAAVEGLRGIDAIAATVDAVLPLDAERLRDWGVWVALWSEADVGDTVATALEGSSDVLGQILARPFAQAIADGDLPEGLDVPYETERLLLMAAGLGLRAKVSGPAVVADLGRRALADHLADLHRRSAVSITRTTDESTEESP